MQKFSGRQPLHTHINTSDLEKTCQLHEQLLCFHRIFCTWLNGRILGREGDVVVIWSSTARDTTSFWRNKALPRSVSEMYASLLVGSCLKKSRTMQDKPEYTRRRTHTYLREGDVGELIKPLLLRIEMVSRKKAAHHI
jgi:hypothetical protein